MKSLYESLLGDMETNLAAGDAYMDEIKTLCKTISTKKNYEKLSDVFQRGLAIDVYLPTLLDYLGYDANMISIFMYVVDSFDYDSGIWNLTIELSKNDEKDPKKFKIIKPASQIYTNHVYMERNEFPKNIDICKNLLKPATKDYETFKKFLEIIEKNDGQMVNSKMLLK